MVKSRDLLLVETHVSCIVQKYVHWFSRHPRAFGDLFSVRHEETLHKILIMFGRGGANVR